MCIRDSTTTKRRPAFPSRPWIRGKLYDDLNRETVLHADADTRYIDQRAYLMIDWKEAGRVQVALDAWLIEADGLTPVWQPAYLWGRGERVYWTARNHAMMCRIHRRVVEQVWEAGVLAARWSRVSLQTHYVHVTDNDPMAGVTNYYNSPARRVNTEAGETTSE